MNIDLTGRHAVVCGSTQGIGKESALTLSKMGASITLIARNEDKLKSVLAELNENAKNDYIVADFSNPKDLEKKIKNWASENKAHILLNNTGGPKGGLIREAKVEEFISAFNNHLVCNHVLVQALYPGMKEEGYGRIVNVISTSVKQPLDGLGVSNTIRGAVANWSKTLANELGQFNITVNNVLPGATNTVRLQSIAENKAAQSDGIDYKEILDNMASMSPMKRIAEPQEVANAVAFLASPAASYINGINVPVDGGRTKSL
ncbi:SDR family oxidoreductase [Brumimicrobium aurantiacum]|uniref:SDR family oxidoreductase n=1 Tax=Brumimicrobium aurantiacum TaxID=1737063 RepID=A0A3E1EVJ7_9FLAO|nr:SDR family oxidoreductase [Brumimicrobium aurantiacum]RFC53570.1 SDR family oxidoreductase [Brumimicrobium aurantiacum]